MADYGTRSKVKERINISDSITDADAKIDSYLEESDEYINTQIGLHATVPITAAAPKAELIELGSGMAAALYNHWNKQGDYKIVLDYKKSIQDYIMARYGKRNLDTNLTVNTFAKSASKVLGTE